MGWFSTPKKPAKRPAKAAKCPCGKRKDWQCDGRRCFADKGTPVKEKVTVTGKDGRQRTVTRNSGRTERDGIVWCRCGCRVLGGRCTNVTCTTRGGRR